MLQSRPNVQQYPRGGSEDIREQGTAMMDNSTKVGEGKGRSFSSRDKPQDTYIHHLYVVAHFWSTGFGLFTVVRCVAGYSHSLY